jgi:pilus assembly protein Flp/PilA
MLQFLQRLVAGRKDETGASAVEYGLLVAAIAALIVVAVFGIGKVVSKSFGDTCTQLKTSSGNGSNTAVTCPAP